MAFVDGRQEATVVNFARPNCQAASSPDFTVFTPPQAFFRYSWCSARAWPMPAGLRTSPLQRSDLRCLACSQSAFSAISITTHPHRIWCVTFIVAQDKRHWYQASAIIVLDLLLSLLDLRGQWMVRLT